MKLFAVLLSLWNNKSLGWNIKALFTAGLQTVGVGVIKGRITVREQSSDRTFRDFRDTTLHLETNSKVASVLLTKSSRVRFHVQTSELLKCCCYKVCISKQLSSCLLRGSDCVRYEEVTDPQTKKAQMNQTWLPLRSGPQRGPPPPVNESYHRLPF